MGKIIFIIILVTLFTNSLYSQNQGPNQPEFTNFSSINDTELVNKNTGDLNYSLPILSIPGKNGFGYNLKLFYNSSFSPDDEASWVGWGWNMNIGSITRVKNGFPDDYYNNNVYYFNKQPDNNSVNLGVEVNPEIMSIESIVSANMNLHYNNVNGFALSYGVGLSAFKGIGNLNFGKDRTGRFSGGYDFNLSPSNVMDALASQGYYSEFSESIRRHSLFRHLGQVSPLSQMGISSLNKQFNTIPTHNPSYTTSIFTGKFSTRIDAFQKVGANANINGSFINVSYEDVTISKAYGFMYSDIAERLNYIRNFIDNENIIKMDYSLDRQNPFTTRDYYLSIPSSNPDEFIVQSEGLQGSFRLHFDKPITFSPSYQDNKNYQFSFGGGVNYKPMTIDALWGFGLNGAVDIAGGNKIEPLNPSFKSKKKRFLFRGDKAMYKNYYPNLVQANVDGDSFSDNDLDNLYNMPNQKASTVVKYRTINDCISLPNENFNKDLNFNISDIQFGNLIAEFKITNTNGNVYIYGKPVFNKNEMNLSFVLPNHKLSKVESNRIYPYKFDEEKNDTKFGNILPTPYSNSYLLTEVRSPNYYDLTGDGPTQDDIGEFVKFKYTKTAGKANFESLHSSISNWVEWRIPFTGYNYDKGEISNFNDDAISYSSGQKEQYYPHAIKTKTHIAIFITNYSNVEYTQDRNYMSWYNIRDDFSIVIDGIEIGNFWNSKYGESENLYNLIKGSGKSREDNWPTNSDYTDGDAIMNNIFSKNYIGKFESNPNRKLERILLFKLDEDAEDTWEKTVKTGVEKLKQVYYVKELVKVVNLDSDYSLRKGTINSLYENGQRTGKLTLNRVWNDYNNVFESKISPHIFKYSYPDVSESDYPDEFNYLENYGLNKIENPDFSLYQTNSWNNYQIGSNNEGGSINNKFLGNIRSANLIHSVNQINPIEYDPGAWKMKKIITPSEGEIHIQYDEKDYSNVQNRKSMGLFKLKNFRVENGNDIYTIDLDDYYGTSVYNDPTTLTEIQSTWDDEFQNKKVYGKILYSYDGSSPSIDDCNADYIEGFVEVDNIVVNGTDIEIVINEDLFKNSCIDKYRNTKNGIACNSFIQNNIFTHGIDAFLNVISAISTIDWGNIASNKCSEIEPSLSYFRLPLVNLNKKSGGARVKRILYFDKFNISDNNNNKGSLYGTEYIYENNDGSSSGVASNEPSILGAENSLVSLLKLREEMNSFDQFISNQREDQFFGPLNKTFLPTPTINYGRVASKSIGLNGNDINSYSKSHNGFQIDEYFTYKDSPFDRKYNLVVDGEKLSGFNHTSIEKYEPYVPLVPTPVSVIDFASITASQGFLFINNNVNGLPKSSQSYSGNYYDKKSWGLKYSREYVYSELGSCLPIFKGFDYNDDEDGPLNLKGGLPGIEYESIVEGKKIDERSVILQANYDVDMGMFFTPPPFGPFPVIYPFPSFAAKWNIHQRIFKSMVNATYVNFTPILKRIKETKDGVVNITDNLIFDSKTGNPILTRVSDEFDQAFYESSTPNDGGIYNYNFPASYFYPTFNSTEEDFNLPNFNWSISSWEPWHIPNYGDNYTHPFSEFKYLYLTSTSSTDAQDYYNVGDKVFLNIEFFENNIVTSGNQFTKNNIEGEVLEVSANQILVVIDALQLGPFEVGISNVELINDNSRKNNRLNEIADYISIYSADTYYDFCGTEIPNHFTTDYTKQIDGLNYYERTIDNNKIANFFNSTIESKIINNNYSESILELDTFNFEMYHALSGNIVVNDTNKIGVSISLDSIDTELPYDSVKVNFKTDYKNILSGIDTIYNHQIVTNLNYLLDEIWISNVANYFTEYSLYLNCYSSDTTGNSIGDYFISDFDSLQNNNLFKKLSFENLLSTNYLIFDEDSTKNSLKNGSELFNVDTNRTKYISFRDLDSNYVLGENRNSYLSELDVRFLNDTINDFFQIGHIKYIKPNNNESDSILSFSLDCRDTSLLAFEYIKDNWNKSYLILPGNSIIKDTISFPDNDSLFNYLSSYNKFTQKFGYFDVDLNGYLVYKTIGSNYGYEDSLTSVLFKIYEPDTNTYQDIVIKSFIINPDSLINPFVVDQSNGSNIMIDISNDEEVDKKQPIYKTKDPVYPSISADNVINASSVTFDIATNDLNFSHQNPNSSLVGDYVNFQESINSYITNREYSSSKTYTSGYFDDFVMFNHFSQTDNESKWQRNIKEKRDQNNYLIESTNLHDNKTSYLYTSDGQLKATVFNSDINSVYFTSFEDFYNTDNENKITDEYSHTGKRSFTLNTTNSELNLNEFINSNSAEKFPITNTLLEKGFKINVWIKINQSNLLTLNEDEYNNPISFECRIGGTQNVINNYELNKISQTGDWTLFEILIFPDELISYTGSLEISIKLNPSSPSINNLCVDDLLFKPIGSESMCYIYNFTNDKLDAVLDNSHHMKQFKYNGKGELVRKSIETYEGGKVFADAQYNLPKTERNIQSTTGLSSKSTFDFKNYPNYRLDPNKILEFLNESEDLQSNSDLDLINININADSSRIDYFDSNLENPVEQLKSIKLPDSLEIKPINKNELDSLHIPTDEFDFNRLNIDSLKNQKQKINGIKTRKDSILRRSVK